jgi:hypothetical protein
LNFGRPFNNFWPTKSFSGIQQFLPIGGLIISSLQPQKHLKFKNTPEYLPSPIEPQYSLIFMYYPTKTNMISRNSIIITRQIPFVLRTMYRQNTPNLRNNLVSILPPNPNQTPRVLDNVKAEYGVALMGAYMFMFMCFMSWVYYRDITFYMNQNHYYREHIKSLQETNAEYFARINYLEDRTRRLDHILLENNPER